MRVLLSWTTTAFRCQIAGELPSVPPFISLPRAFVGANTGRLVLVDNQEVLLPGTEKGPPLFLEQQLYTVSVDWKGPKAEVVATGGHVLTRIDFDDSDRSTYQLNFGPRVGLAAIRIATSVLTIEVLPRKIEYRGDYRVMKRDIVNQAHSLAFDVLGRTEERVKQFSLAFPTEAESYVIAKSLTAELLRLINLLEREPHKALAIEQRLVRLEPGTRLRSTDWRRITRARPYRQGDIALVEKVHQMVQTPENEFIKWALVTTMQRLSVLERQLADPSDQSDGTSAPRFAQEVHSIEHTLRGQVNRGFLADVSAKAPTHSRLSLVFQLHPVYRQIYHDCQLLLSGLELEGYLLQMGVKDVATLYEYWSFLTVVALIQRYAQIESTSLIRVEKRKASLRLVKGRQSSVRFRRHDGSTIEVIYNTVMDPIYTTPQQPDTVIEVRSRDVRLILDAKYRIQFDAEYVRRYGGPGPTEDDINKMHRYRDAVLFQLGTERRKAGEAVALFPLPPSVPYAGVNRFHRSINLVGIGGIPCYPNGLAVLETYLAERLAL